MVPPTDAAIDGGDSARRFELPASFSNRPAPPGVGPGRREDAVACQMLVTELGITNGLGQITGILFGPGRSGSRIV